MMILLENPHAELVAIPTMQLPRYRESFRIYGQTAQLLFNFVTVLLRLFILFMSKRLELPLDEYCAFKTAVINIVKELCIFYHFNR